VKAIKSLWFSRPTERDSGEFECLARAMKKNRVSQFEFALLLRLLSGRFPLGSRQRRALRVASNTAQRKGERLTDLLQDLQYVLFKPRNRRLALLVWIYFTKLMPPKLVVAWLNQTMEKQVHTRILDLFRKGEPETRIRTTPPALPE
jgi:hypothetical protein